MDEILTALQGLAPIEALRFSRWGYAAVNTTHVFGIALLVGGSIPLALRLLGLWPSVPRASVVRILAKTTGVGLALAVVSGFLLFATRAPEYAGLSIFLIKMLLVVLGASSAIMTSRRFGWDLADAPDSVARAAGMVSILCWIGALVCGRLVAFVQG